MLKLPLTAPGVGKNIDLIKRPVPGEDTASILYGERLFGKASLRILLSDKATDITNIPGVTATAPVFLEGDWKTTPPFAGYAGQPIARSLGNTATLATTNAATALGAATISLAAAVPAMFQKPNVSIKNALGTVLATCSGPWTAATSWTPTTIGNCNVTAAVATGNTVYITGAGTGVMPQSAGGTLFKPTATVQGAVVIGSGKTVTVGSGTTTFPFAANSFFINDVGAGGTGISTPVTCAGTTATSFTSCTGVPATVSGATITTGYVTPQDTATIGGYIKIEIGKADGTYQDVTQEILNYGISDADPPSQAGNLSPCADPSPNAIVRIQRFRQTNANTTAFGTTPTVPCSVGDTSNSYEYWPQVLFDSREGVQRDGDPGTFSMVAPFGGGGVGAGVTAANSGLQLGGVMYYIALDVKNLAKWFKASEAPYNVVSTGLNAKIDNTGYTVYFSDRRNNRNISDLETGEYGFEDLVNPGVANGTPDGICQAGEDVNDVTGCDLYGAQPSYNGVHNSVPAGSVAPLVATATPTTRVKRAVAQVNRPIFFRRALKLINGSTINNDPTNAARNITGLTVVSENPVYIQGDYNATPAANAVTSPHAATAVIADAVSIMSTSWTDNASFFQPFEYNWYPTAFGAAGAGGGRLRGNAAGTIQSYYRVAVLGGKGPNFLKPSDVGAAASVFGTDGGAHNFLRMVEQDPGAGVVNTVNYRGSMATLAYNRQALGSFKCCSGTAADGIVYSVPTRNFAFDTDFLNPALLPPNTPQFRDINAVGFSQELRPGR